MITRRHHIPTGARVSFKGDSTLYTIDNSQAIVECPEQCSDSDFYDHECYPEPYLFVELGETLTARPLSQLENIFDGPDGTGRSPNPAELV